MTDRSRQTVAPRSIALGVEYDGTLFHGFQSQNDVPTVQDTLERALSKVADEPVTIAAAGRTDAGVHATEQVVSFEFGGQRPSKAWVRGTNAHLPAGISILWARPIAGGFHARFDAVSRRYVYVYGERDPIPAIGRNLATWTHERLDHAGMHGAAQMLVGEQDFSSFRAAGCQSRSPVRRVHSVSVCRVGDFVYVDICANAFLLHMVRNIASALRSVGVGDLDAGGLAALIRAKDRTLGPPTAPSQGLYFVNACYPVLTRPEPVRAPAILGPLVLD